MSQHRCFTNCGDHLFSSVTIKLCWSGMHSTRFLDDFMSTKLPCPCTSDEENVAFLVWQLLCQDSKIASKCDSSPASKKQKKLSAWPGATNSYFTRRMFRCKSLWEETRCFIQCHCKWPFPFKKISSAATNHFFSLFSNRLFEQKRGVSCVKIRKKPQKSTAPSAVGCLACACLLFAHAFHCMRTENSAVFLAKGNESADIDSVGQICLVSLQVLINLALRVIHSLWLQFSAPENDAEVVKQHTSLTHKRSSLDVFSSLNSPTKGSLSQCISNRKPEANNKTTCGRQSYFSKRSCRRMQLDLFLASTKATFACSTVLPISWSQLSQSPTSNVNLFHNFKAEVDDKHGKQTNLFPWVRAVRG